MRFDRFEIVAKCADCTYSLISPRHGDGVVMAVSDRVCGLSSLRESRLQEPEMDASRGGNEL